jgi:diguanylate cyclase (GGDEF)-like protein/PAS domain S-box-containing protein
LSNAGSVVLRRRAEANLASHDHHAARLVRADLESLAHELTVHQAELEIQNEELREARAAAEVARNRYLDLYDFAPVGYFTLDEHNRIVEANLTGCRLLQMDRRTIKNRLFTKSIAVDETERFYMHRKGTLESEDRQTFELKMQKADGSLFYAQLDSIKAGKERLRVALHDISERKKMEAALVEAVEREAAVSALSSKLVSSVSISDISEEVLKSAARFTLSAHGFVGYVDLETGYMISPAMTKGIGVSAQGKNETDVIKDFGGFCELVVNSRRSLLSNAPTSDPALSGTKPGRAVIHNLLSAPALIGDELVGHVAVANSNRSYTQRDLELVERLATVYAIAVQRDRTEARIRRLAFHDPLTGLPNRALFDDRYSVALAGARRYHKKIGLMVIDIDHFKTINDALGHSAGDEVLKEFSRRLLGVLRKSDTATRLGGDEFVVMMLNVVKSEHIAKVAQKMIDAIRDPFTLRGQEVLITASVGISSYPEDAEDVETLLKCADAAMYRVKEAGRDSYAFCTPVAETQLQG